jgi:hypothetical protein
MSAVWLCTAIVFIGTSQTTQRLMYGGISEPLIGIIGSGAVVDSQNDLSLRLA